MPAVPVIRVCCDAFSRMRARGQVVASSLVCLPEVDAGGYGPKVESWAFATDSQGLEVLQGFLPSSLRAVREDLYGGTPMGEDSIPIASQESC